MMTSSDVLCRLLWVLLWIPAHLGGSVSGRAGAATIDCPFGCLCPTASGHVSCENAGLTEVPRVGISPSVTSLDLTGNQLVILTSGSLSALRNVVRLKLANNEIERILEGAFEPTSSLQTLDLSLNNLTVVQQQTFRGAEMLLHLDLSDNRLTSVDGAFSGLRELSRLDLRGNRLTEITQFTFRDQVNLRYLLLSNNRINHVERRSFRNLEKLMYLVLRGNPLTAVDRFQFHSLFLSYVDLSECGLTSVPRGLPASIRYLQLRRNNMTSIQQNTFRDCSYVSILVLDENSISEIEAGAFDGMLYLQQLWLNHNSLRRLTVRLPASLQRLFIESNSLLELSGDVIPPTDAQLTALSLAGNNLAELPVALLSRLPLLRSLDASVNNIRRIYAGTFSNNTRLRSLQLSRNPLEYLYSGCLAGPVGLRHLGLAFVPSVAVTVSEEAFQTLTGLAVLDMDSSPALIRSVLASDKLLASLSSVHELGLLNSHLSRLRHDFATYFRSLVVVRLSSARWHCDAESAAWIRGWIASTGVEVVGAGEIRCLTPTEFRGRSLLTLADWELHRLGSPSVTHWPHQPLNLNASTPTVSFGRVRPQHVVVTSSPRQPGLKKPEAGGRGRIDRKWSPSRPTGPLDDEDGVEADFIDRSDDMFRIGHHGPRWDIDDDDDLDTDRQNGFVSTTVKINKVTPTTTTIRSILKTTQNLGIMTSSSPDLTSSTRDSVAGSSILHHTRATVERRQLEPQQPTATRQTHQYDVPEAEIIPPPSDQMLTNSDGRQSAILSLTIVLTVLITLSLVVVIVVIIIKITTSNRRQTGNTNSNNRHGIITSVVQNHEQPPPLQPPLQPQPQSATGCDKFNGGQHLIASNCILVGTPKSMAAVGPAKTDSPLPDFQRSGPAERIANGTKIGRGHVINSSSGDGTAVISHFQQLQQQQQHHMLHHYSSATLSSTDRRSTRQPRYELIDQSVTFDDVTMTSGIGCNSGSSEALSRRPGRDINHEGPHLVYQWADF